MHLLQQFSIERLLFSSKDLAQTNLSQTQTNFSKEHSKGLLCPNHSYANLVPHSPWHSYELSLLITNILVDWFNFTLKSPRKCFKTSKNRFLELASTKHSESSVSRCIILLNIPNSDDWYILSLEPGNKFILVGYKDHITKTSVDHSWDQWAL